LTEKISLRSDHISFLIHSVHSYTDAPMISQSIISSGVADNEKLRRKTNLLASSAAFVVRDSREDYTVEMRVAQLTVVSTSFIRSQPRTLGRTLSLSSSDRFNARLWRGYEL